MQTAAGRALHRSPAIKQHCRQLLGGHGAVCKRVARKAVAVRVQRRSPASKQNCKKKSSRLPPFLAAAARVRRGGPCLCAALRHSRLVHASFDRPYLPHSLAVFDDFRSIGKPLLSSTSSCGQTGRQTGRPRSVPMQHAPCSPPRRPPQGPPDRPPRPPRPPQSPPDSPPRPLRLPRPPRPPRGPPFSPPLGQPDSTSRHGRRTRRRAQLPAQVELTLRTPRAYLPRGDGCSPLEGAPPPWPPVVS